MANKNTHSDAKFTSLSVQGDCYVSVSDIKAERQDYFHFRVNGGTAVSRPKSTGKKIIV